MSRRESGSSRVILGESRTAVMVALVLALTASGSRADEQRFRVEIGDLPATYVDSAARYASSIGESDALTPVVVKKLPGTPAALTAPATATQGASFTRPSGSVKAADTTANPAPQEELAQVALTDPGTPTPEFRARIQQIYQQSDEAIIQGAWAFFVKEPPSLDFNTRTNNSMVRYILATGQNIGEARPNNLVPDATRARVRATGGLSLRSGPWEKITGSVTEGSAVDIEPPPVGSWYKVSSSGGSGWVSGIYLDFQ